MLGEEAGDLLGIADELERRALTHEKLIAHLDLPRARLLRALASRIRKVVSTTEGNGDRDAVHGEVVGLRLEAMCALLEEPGQPPPLVSPPGSVPRSGVTYSDSGEPSEDAPSVSPIPIGRVHRRRG